MRKTTEKEKRAAILWAALFVLLLAVCLALLFLPALSIPAGRWLAIVVCAAVIAAMLVGVIIAAMQRVRELDGGEEEDAKRY